MNNLILNIISWLGTFLIIGSYLLLRINKIKSTDYLFSISNIIGGLFIAIPAGYKGLYAVTFLQVVWIFITLFTIKWKNKNETKDFN